MATSSVIRVSLLGDAKDLNKAFDTSAGKAKTWGTKMGDAGKALSLGLTAPIVAGAGLAVKAAAEEAQQMEVLAGVIKQRIPGATDEAVAANEEWITSLQNLTGIADSEIRDMEQKFVAAGSSIEDAQKLTALAFDTAAATGKDAASVGDAFVKGLNNQVSGLSRLGIQTKKADGTTKSFNEIQEELAATMGGTAANAADTAAGRAEIMRLKMADLTEEIGAILIPILDKFVSWLSKITDWFSNLSPQAKTAGVVILGIAAAIGPVLIVGSKLVSAFGAIKKAYLILKVALMANPWIAIVTAVVALVVLIVLNWDKIVAFLKRTWKWIKDTAAAVWSWLKETFQKGLDFIVGLFLKWTLVGQIVKHWDKIRDGVRAVIDFIKDKFNGVIDWFKGLPERLGRAVSGLFNGLKTAFKNAVNWIIGKWNDFKISIKLPAILGGSTLTIDTPNIPKFHQGGTYRAPAGRREGLALLSDRETVLKPGARADRPTVVYLTVNALDPRTAGVLVVQALQDYVRTNGAVPVTVRQ